MRRIVATVVALGWSVGALAIDRDAWMIDTLAFEVAEYRDQSRKGVSLWVENALADESENWAILAGVAGNRLKFDNGERLDSWMVGVGVRRYLLPVTSVALVGSYRNDNRNAFKTAGGSLILQQRLLPASAAVSPWVTGSLALQDVNMKRAIVGSRDSSYTATIVALDAGCDFMAARNFAFVFSAGFSESSAFHTGNRYADGFRGSIAMRYYWD